VVRSPSLAVAMFCLAFAVVGCSVTGDHVMDDTPPDPTADGSVYGGFPVDPPAPDEVVLTIEGPVRIDFTMAELEALAVIDVLIDEPFVRRRETYRVVLLRDLIERAGIGPDASVTTIALNDYRYDDSVMALREAGAMLAVARDGAPIPMDAGGPIRLVYPGDSTYASLLDAWNWSLRTIRVVEGP
jgi:hypothetical protein